MTELFIFGLGYSARRIARELARDFTVVTGTHRTARPEPDLSCRTLVFDGRTRNPEIAAALGTASHLLVSIGPGEGGDPVLAAHLTDIEAAARAGTLRWIGYLSTVGVYGDHGGERVDETTVCRPVSRRSILRLEAEQAWTGLAREAGVPLGVFRLSGIYGPGRNGFLKLEAGTARRIVKPGQVFNRIHVEDIASAVAAAARQKADGIFNITDDEPAPPQDVVAHAAGLMGIEPPPEIAFEAADLTPMGRSFYGENKRVSNAKAKREIGWQPRYPTYREAQSAMRRDESWR